MPGWINVALKVETRNRLDKIKEDLPDNVSKSYDRIINDLLDDLERTNNEIIGHSLSHKIPNS